MDDGGMMLPTPQGELVCTHPRATRVVMTFFEAYQEGKIIAMVPHYLYISQYIAEKTLIIQLL